MSNIIDVSLFFNAIPEQRLTYANQLTIASWNDTINTIRVQLNALTQYLKQFDYLFFDEANPYNWYSTVIRSNTVPVGELDDDRNTISYYGIKAFVVHNTNNLSSQIETISEQISNNIMVSLSYMTPIGNSTDSINTVSYHGLKNRIDNTSSIHVGDTAPSNTMMIWFDTSDDDSSGPIITPDPGTTEPEPEDPGTTVDPGTDPGTGTGTTEPDPVIPEPEPEPSRPNPGIYFISMVNNVISLTTDSTTSQMMFYINNGTIYTDVTDYPVTEYDSESTSTILKLVTNNGEEE